MNIKLKYSKTLPFSIFTIIVLFVHLTNSQYEIPSYYGFWSKNFFQIQNITSGTFSIFEIHFSLDINYQSTKVYFANKIQHCIFQYQLKNKKYTVIAGKCLKSGNKIGDSENSLLNNPYSIAYYKPDPQRSANLTKMKTFLTQNQQCLLNDNNCILTHSQLINMQLSLKNIRFQPQINLFSIDQNINDEYLIISDTMNHCIKKLSLTNKHIQVIAGSCGQSGFLDGPEGINRLNMPTNIGIDGKGVIYFFDEGNKYMRKINLKNEVETLLNGACKEYKRANEENRKVNNYELRKMICYQDWIERETAGRQQHYFDESVLNFCTFHSSKCNLNTV